MTFYTYLAHYYNEEKEKNFHFNLVAFMPEDAMSQAVAKTPEGYKLVKVEHVDRTGKVFKTFTP